HRTEPDQESTAHDTRRHSRARPAARGSPAYSNSPPPASAPCSWCRKGRRKPRPTTPSNSAGAWGLLLTDSSKNRKAARSASNNNGENNQRRLPKHRALPKRYHPTQRPVISTKDRKRDTPCAAACGAANTSPTSMRRRVSE